MTRSFTLTWPDPAPFRGRGGTPIRLLATSDVVEPALADARNRRALQPVDLLLGCGDLDGAELAFMADAFDVPLLHVLGNHDNPTRSTHFGACPAPISSASVSRAVGLAVAGLPWPGSSDRHETRSELTAWRQSVRLAARRVGQADPFIVISHAPPLGAGDIADGTYHRGLPAYRWLLGRTRPRLWLHGHTPLAAARDWHMEMRATTVVNVTGSVLIELRPPGAGS
jgi:uncharacterized protein